MSSSRDILDQRLASGEISHEDFERLVRVLEQGSAGSPTSAVTTDDSVGWYYDMNEEAVGPHGKSHLAGLLHSGTISSNTLVWREGFEDWRPLSDTELARMDNPVSTPPHGKSNGTAKSCAKCGAVTPGSASYCLECGASLNVAKQGVSAPVSSGAATTSTHTPVLQVYQPDLATFGARFGAYLIDTIAWLILTFVFGFLAGIAIAVFGWNPAIIEGETFGLVITFVAWVLYFSIMEASGWQATFGKRMLGVKVVDLEGNRIDGSTGIGRSISKFLSGLILIGYLMPLWTKRRQALHDFMASTLVVRR